MKMLLCAGAFILFALPASAQVQFQIGGTAGFGSSSNTNSSSGSSVWNNAPLGDAYFSSSLQVGKLVSLYAENLIALRERRNGFSGFGAAFRFGTEVGYLGAGLGSYGWRGMGTRLFIGWPTGRSQTFELSYTRLRRGGSTEPVFTYGIRF